MVIDGDGHIVEPLSLWKDYVPKAFQDRIRVEYDEQGYGKRVIADNVEFNLLPPEKYRFSPGDSITPGGYKEGNCRKRRWEDGAAGGFSGEERLKMHDAEGIDAAVVFPTQALCLANDISDREVARIFMEGVNNWAADFRAVAPEELYPVATLSTRFPDLAAEEFRRCVKEYGFVAGCIRPTPLIDNGRQIDHADMDPIWAAAEELDVPITIHNVAFPNPYQAGEQRATTFILTHSGAHPFEGMYAFGCLLENRIFERFPTLRVGFMESSCGWVPFWTERLEEHVEMIGWTLDPPLKLEPMELFRERCAVGTEGEEKMVAYVQEVIGEESVIWSSDYPHFDTESPFVLPREDLTDRQRDGLYRRAALKFYRLDETAIARSNARRRSSLRHKV